MKIYHSLPELIGHTPLFSADNFSREQGLETPILAKLEYFNPAGSIKDRVALNIIEKAAVQGLIQKGSTIIEPTSGQYRHRRRCNLRRQRLQSHHRHAGKHEQRA